jgi:hypothetical protein
VLSCSSASFSSDKIIVEFSIRFKFFCWRFIGSRDISPIVIECRGILWIGGDIVAVKILTTRLRIIIVIKTRWRNWREHGGTRRWLGGSSTSCRWGFGGWSAWRLVRRRWVWRRLWGGRRSILPPFLCMLTSRSAAFGWWTILEFFTNRFCLDRVFDDDQVVFCKGRRRTVDFRAR